MERLIYVSDLVKSLLDYENGKKTLGQCIDDTPTAQLWIPGKPKESGMYLVSGTEHFVPDHVDEPSTKDGAVGIAAYSEKWGWLDHKIHPVKAYMPLPKAYVSRKKERDDI